MSMDVVALLQQLVRIPSVNPDSHPGTDCSNLGEEKIARQVGELLGKLGAEVHFEDVQPGRPNVIGRFPCRGTPKARVLLAPHLDTVGVGGMTIDPFEGEIADGRVYGRGACDTKGTMAAMLAALAELHGRLPDFSTEITFVGLMGEETGQPGSIDFARRHAGAYDFALVGEPTGCQIVHAHKGCTWMDLAARGRACHASRPDLGDNAIVIASRLVLALDGKFRQLLRENFSDPVLGETTINPGEIHGGTRPNIVPDRATLTIDMRTTPAFVSADPVKVLTDFLDREFPGCAIHVYERFSCRPLHTPAGDPMLQRLLEATGRELTTAPWFCDAAHLAVGGIPSVAAGPGSIEQAHTEDEWISIEALEEGVEFYRSFLASLE
jgi:acetylornithine deacetylase/succinyl-diaminopimelate desuccinylase-like protein